MKYRELIHYKGIAIYLGFPNHRFKNFTPDPEAFYISTNTWFEEKPFYVSQSKNSVWEYLDTTTCRNLNPKTCNNNGSYISYVESEEKALECLKKYIDYIQENK